MKSVLPLFGLLFSFGAPKAFAYNVGDTAACVVLNQVAPDGKESEHCIRDTKAPGEAKLIEFFSATCSDCQANLPNISSLNQRLEGKATTRLVGIDRSETLLRDYIKSNRSLIQFEVALDTNRDAKRTYDVIETPTLYVLDHQNKILYKHTGVLNANDMSEVETIVETHR